MSMGLERFTKAQEDSYEIALAEIKSGRKDSHWMWYVFPQIEGLGFSEISMYYAIRDLDEAKEYLADPILGKRLLEISTAVAELPETNAGRIFGTPDDLKLRSSMTLFHCADPDEKIFSIVLDKYYDGEMDPKTLEILKKQALQ